MSIIMKKRKQNKKKQNVKNIDIIFDARQLFNPRHTRQNLIRATYAPMAPTLPTLSRRLIRNIY